MPRPMMPPQTAKNSKLAIKKLLEYVKGFMPFIIIAIIFSVASTILAVLGPDKLSDLTNIIERGINLAALSIDIDMDAVTKAAMTLVAMYGSSMILGYLQSFIMGTVSAKIAYKLRKDINLKINKIPLSYFDSHRFGDTLSIVTNDVDMISQSIGNSISSLVSSIVMLLGCLFMMFKTQWIMAFSAIGATLIGFVAMSVIMKHSQKYFIARQISLAKVNGHVEEHYAGQSTIRVYNAEEKAHMQFDQYNKELKKNSFKAEFLSGLMPPLMGFIGNLGYVVVCIVGAALAFNDVIPFSVVVAFMIYVRLFTSPLNQIAHGMTSIQSAAAASERVFDFLENKELEDESAKIDRIENVEGNIAFHDVSFGYLEDKTIIHNFTAEIKAGQKVAIVGPTGAGKTTMVNLLMRFYEVDSGEIVLDGKDIKKISRENLHDQFGMILQDTWLFDGTIRENLTYGTSEPVSDEKLWEIVRDVGLEHFVKTLPKGLDSVVDETLQMSAGQKQLLTIARAMIKNSPMMILDEATSSVDTKTERKIQAAIDKLTEKRTSFVIAHRLSTIRNADVIIYMEDGDIKEIGNHNTLIAKDGLYKKLYYSQFDPVA